LVTSSQAQIPHGEPRGSSGHGTQAVLGVVDVTVHNWAVFYVRDADVSRMKFLFYFSTVMAFAMR